PEISVGIFLRAFDVAGEKSAAEGAERNESDAELAQQRNDALFEIALPQRVLALQRRHGMDSMRAADRVLARFRQSEVAHFPRAHEIGDRPRDVFDRHFGIDARLIEEIDRVDAEALQRSVDRLANLLRPARDARHLAVFALPAELRRAPDVAAPSAQRA